MLVDAIHCLNWWGALRWRHHATGLLQAYIPNDSSMRVHIWHRGLKQNDSGEMHNHRFTLQSHVLVGSLTHERLLLTPDEENGTHDIWDIPGASQGSNETLRLHDRTSVKGSRVSIERTERTQFKAGDSYTLMKWDFHHARQEPDDAELTVTFVRLLDKEHGRAASLLHPSGHTPTHAFTEAPEPPVIIALLNAAAFELKKAVEFSARNTW
jgi:hypothetical protein